MRYRPAYIIPVALVTLGVASLAALLAGCGTSPGTPPAGADSGSVSVTIVRSAGEVQAAAVPSSAVEVKLTISAADITPPIVKVVDFPAGTDTVNAAIQNVPAGANRLLSVIAKNVDSTGPSMGNEVAVGSALLTVVPGGNEAARITLTPTAEGVTGMAVAGWPAAGGYGSPSIVVGPGSSDPSTGVITLGRVETSHTIAEDHVLVVEEQMDPDNLYDQDYVLCAPVSVSQYPGPLDLVFVIDVSMSMDEERESIVDTLDAFVADLVDAGNDLMLGVVTFRYDNANPDGYLDLTTDVDAVKGFIGGLSIHSGGASTRAENGNMGILYAHRNFGWRGDSERVYIVVTDEPFQPGTSGMDADAVVAELKGTPSKLVVVCPDFDNPSHPYYPLPSGVDDPKDLATRTGGAWCELIAPGYFDLVDLDVHRVLSDVYTIEYPTTLLGTEKRVRLWICSNGAPDYDGDSAKLSARANWAP